MPPSFTESVVEEAALSWVSELNYSMMHGAEIAPGEVAPERATLGESYLARTTALHSWAAESQCRRRIPR